MPLERSHNSYPDSTTSVTDERGAVMLAGLFMTMFLVAMLYFVIGIGQTIVQREGMQDAADASSFAAAIWHAKGMNLIAFLNIVMQSLITILIAIRMTQTMLYVGAGILLGLSWFGGATAPVAHTLKYYGDLAGRTYTKTKPKVHNLLEVIHTTQEGVSATIPWIALGDGMIEAATYHAPAKGAVALPAARTLPIEADEFSELCGRATADATEAALDLVFFPVPDGAKKFVADPISNAMGSVGSKTSSFLCGDGKGKPPVYENQLKRIYPRQPGIETCQDDPHSATCQKASRDAEDAIPLGGQKEDVRDDGECRARCGYSEPYEWQARRAREQCEPRKGFRPQSFRWQKGYVSSTFTFNGSHWEEDKRLRWTEYKETSRPPCGQGGTLDDEEWNKDSGPPSNRSPEALCFDKDDLDFLEETPEAGTRVQAEYVEATRLFACTITTTEEIPMATSEETIGDGGADKAPHRLDRNLKTLGGEAFQIRSLAFGKPPGPSNTAIAGVRAAAWNSKEGEQTPGQTALSGIEELMRLTGGVSVAQAEFYFDHDGSVAPKEWLWEMKWKARLRRFRMPTEAEKKKESDRRKESAERAQKAISRFAKTPNRESSSEENEQADLLSRLVIH